MVSTGIHIRTLIAYMYHAVLQPESFKINDWKGSALAHTEPFLIICYNQGGGAKTDDQDVLFGTCLPKNGCGLIFSPMIKKCCLWSGTCIIDINFYFFLLVGDSTAEVFVLV